MAIALRTMVIPADGPPWRIKLKLGQVWCLTASRRKFEEHDQNQRHLRAVEVARCLSLVIRPPNRIDESLNVLPALHPW